MSVSRVSRQPPGVVATIVGGLAGAVVVFLVGPPIANAIASDGLGGLGTALALLFGMWCVGTGLGVFAALRLRGHERAMITALLAVPGMGIALVATFFVAADIATPLLFWMFLVGGCVLVLWLARLLTMSVARQAQVKED